MWFSVLLLCCFVSVGHCNEQCIRIKQDGEAIVNEPTDLNCVLQGDDVGIDSGFMYWFLVDKTDSNEERGLVTLMISDGEGTPDVEEDYEGKVDSSWDGDSDTFTLTIKKVILDDDEQSSEWRCSVVSDPCTLGVNHNMEVKGILSIYVH